MNYSLSNDVGNTMLTRLLIFLVCALAASTIHARMYQWQDPESGTTHFSGKPPSWYRTGHGPRVIVFEQGRVIDDTNIAVSGDVSATLRNQAIARAEADREKARQKAMAAEKLKSNLAPDEALPEPENMAEEIPVPEANDLSSSPPLPSPAATAGELTEEDMRALIRQWEEQRTQQARQQLEDSGLQ